MEKGNSADGCLPKFFKFYLPGESGDDLKVPISFNSFLPNCVSKSVIVRSIYGNVWKLELRKCRGDTGEKFVLVNGWKRIAKDENLKGGEFLAFEFDGSRLFNFCIFDQTACKRLGKSVKTKEIKDESEIYSDDICDDQDYGDDDENDDGSDEDDDQREYLDDRDNPSFTVILNPKKRSQLLIPARVVKDYNLNFPERITVADPLVTKFGTLEKKIKVQDNKSVFLKGFGSIIRRNNVKTTDKMICELKKSGSNLVHTIKVHVVRG